MPRCLGASGSVRTSRNPQSQNWACEFQTFCPFTTNSSPSRSARMPSPARSLPAPGSLNSWQKASSPDSSPGTKRSFCCSVPCRSSVGPSMAMVAPMNPGHSS